MSHRRIPIEHDIVSVRALTGIGGFVQAEAVTDKYSISVDRLAAFVSIKLGGFFALEDVQQFAAAQARAYEILASARGHHVTLCDVSECKIQPQEVVEAFRGLLTDEKLMSKRMAFITGVSPAKMQIRRLISRDTCRFFQDAESAERWLLGTEYEPLSGGPSATDS